MNIRKRNQRIVHSFDSIFRSGRNDFVDRHLVALVRFIESSFESNNLPLEIFVSGIIEAKRGKDRTRSVYRHSLLRLSFDLTR